MKRPGAISVYVLGGISVVLALSWLTWNVLDLERKEAAASRRAAEQQTLRLALWRMDSLLGGLVARESARPYFEYRPFYPAGRAYTSMLEEVQADEVLVPSNLLSGGDPRVRLYFEIGPDGSLTSPQAPLGNLRDLAESVYLEPEEVDAASELLSTLDATWNADQRAQGTVDLAGVANPGIAQPPQGPPGQVYTGTLYIAPARTQGGGDGSGNGTGGGNAGGDPGTQTGDPNLPPFVVSTTQRVAQGPQSQAPQLQPQQQQGAGRTIGDGGPLANSGQPPPGTIPQTQIPVPSPGAGQSQQPPSQTGTSVYLATGGLGSRASNPSQAEQQAAQEYEARRESFNRMVAADINANDPSRNQARGGGPRGSTSEAVAQAPEPPAVVSIEAQSNEPTYGVVASPPSSPADASAKPAAPVEPVSPSAAPMAPAPTDSTKRVLQESKDKEQHSTTEPAPNQAKTRLGLIAVGAGGSGPSTADAPAPTPKPKALAPKHPAEPARAVRAKETGPIILGPFQPLWLMGMGEASGHQLVFVREVAVQGKSIRQGLWIDWPALRSSLVASVADILPDADLKPIIETPGLLAVSGNTNADLGRRLAGIPAELIPGHFPFIAESPRWTPMRTTIVVAWLVVLAAGLVIARMVRAAEDLAERRGRFVSAVTHELRTPLTTFCLYSQMLADGMVKEEEAKRDYLSTLKGESQRLAGIVENVLAYARLGKHGKHDRIEMSAKYLVDRVLPVLEGRTTQGGMTLRASLSDELEAAHLATDPRCVERILHNLVDNACKYAAESDGVIEFLASARAGRLHLSIRDHGPGVPQAEAERIFTEFYRGSAHAHHGNTPGLGLGLALARNLAQDIQGQLTLDSSNPATFTLTLPLNATA